MKVPWASCLLRRPKVGPSSLALVAVVGASLPMAPAGLAQTSTYAARASTGCRTDSRPAPSAVALGFTAQVSAVSEDTNHVFFAGTDCQGKGRLATLDTRSGKFLRSVTVPAQSRLGALDVVHHRLLLFAGLATGAESVSFVDTRTGTVVLRRRLSDGVNGLVVLGRNRRAVLSAGNDLDTIDTVTGRVKVYLRGKSLLGVNNRLGLLYAYDGRILSLIDTHTLSVRNTAEVGDCGTIQEAQVDARAGTIFAGSSGSVSTHEDPTSGSLCRLDARTGDVLQIVDLGPGGEVHLPLVDEAAGVVLAVVRARGSHLAGFNALDSRTGRLRVSLPPLWTSLGSNPYTNPVADPRTGWIYGMDEVKWNLLRSIRPRDWHVQVRDTHLPGFVLALASRARHLFLANQYVVMYRLSG